MIITKFDICALMSIVIYILIRVVLYIKNNKIDVFRELVDLSYIAYMVVLIGITLVDRTWRGEFESIAIQINPFDMLSRADVSGMRLIIYNLGGNIAMFLPFGFLTPLVFSGKFSILKIGMFSLLFSFLIESMQLILTYIGIIGRSFDTADLIMNTIGGIIGYIIYKLLNISRFKSSNY